MLCYFLLEIGVKGSKIKVLHQLQATLMGKCANMI